MQIVEPHMYNVDDAVAKIDSYVISVARGGRHVGTKRLVRIEEAGRTSATATLVDDGSADGGPEGSPDDDALESTARRRGRRGGRRRSAAPAAPSSD